MRGEAWLGLPGLSFSQFYLVYRGEIRDVTAKHHSRYWYSEKMVDFVFIKPVIDHLSFAEYSRLFQYTFCILLSTPSQKIVSIFQALTQIDQRLRSFQLSTLASNSMNVGPPPLQLFDLSAQGRRCSPLRSKPMLILDQDCTAEPRTNPLYLKIKC